MHQLARLPRLLPIAGAPDCSYRLAPTPYSAFGSEHR